MTTEYTDHFRLNLPDFRMGPWHDLVNEDFITLDQLLFSLYQGVDTQTWENNKLYMPGTTAIDPDDNTFWVAIIEHTSAPTGSFSADRAAHPTYWNRVVVGIAPRGEWANDTHYLPNDMVTDSSEHVIAVCITEHTSNASGTIRDDEAYWSFIADIGSAEAVAANVSYDNTASGAAATNVQDALDYHYSRDASQQSSIDANTAAVANHGPRITNLETSDSNQNTAIATNANNITNLTTRVTNTENKNTAQDTRLTNLETSSATHITDAPADGVTYARQNHAWIDVLSVAGASVLVSDNPPAGARDSSLWWESDTGILYIKYNDGDSSQWVAVSDGGAGAVRFDAAQLLTATQQMQARSNIYAAPFDALAYSGIQMNGSCEISQENGANGIPVANAAKNIIDGWVLQSGGPQAVVGNQGAGGPAGFSNILQAYNTTINAAPTGTDHCFFYTPIEGYRVARLGWGAANASPITIAFWVFSTKTGTFSGVVRNSAANRSYVFTYTINAATTWEYKVITIPGDTTGTWEKTNLKGMIVGLALLSGTTYATATPNTWISSDVWALIGTQNVVNAGDYFQFTGFVVLPGIEAPSAARSPLIMRPADQELITCMRHFESCAQIVIQSPAAGSFISVYSYKVKKRVPATAIIVGAPSYSNANSATMNGPTTDAVNLQFNATAAGGFAAWSFNIDARM